MRYLLPPTLSYPSCVCAILTPSPFLFSITFLTAAHPNNPIVTPINVNTTIWSFLLSLWKHVVKTSFSSAFLHIGKCWARQKALLQVLQVVPAARGVLSVVDECVERGMMVLLAKQVHLQNDGGAGGFSLLKIWEGWRWAYKLLMLIL
jgi:hypothetical protein